jgi:nucleoside-diphosphate-sugar epimerase
VGAILTMALPRLVVTGASGFIGRHLLELVRSRYDVVAIGRRSQSECGAPVHPNISWHQVDIGEREPLARLFGKIRDDGGADYLIHLAAHYDFTGDEHPEYWRTNVGGLRNVLDLSRDLGLKRFVFASSVAACRFPKPGEALTESTPALGEHVYSQTKRIGEEMLAEYEDAFPCCIVRFAALFSDWCEYPPLFVFLDTWLSDRWNARVLGGKGLSAVPYLHVRDAAFFLQTVLDKEGELGRREVLQCSPDGSVSHWELFKMATAYYFGRERKPMLMPKALCWPGMWSRDLLGRMLGNRPFERPWMARYIDLKLTVDASRTRRRLGWAQRPRLDVLRRIPFLIENLRSNPVEWYRRNREAMKIAQIRPNLVIHRLLELHEDEITDTFTAFLLGPEGREHLESYQNVAPEDHEWNHRMVLRNLTTAVRTREKGVFMAYCRDLAERRAQQGFREDELCYALASLNDICLDVLRRDPQSKGLEEALQNYVTMTIQFGIDHVQEVYEYFRAGRSEVPESRIRAQMWDKRGGPHPPASDD